MPLNREEVNEELLAEGAPEGSLYLIWDPTYPNDSLRDSLWER